MGKIFLNKEFNAHNVFEVEINLEKLKEFEIIKKSYIWNTNKEIFQAEQFASTKPKWGGDMEWISANNVDTYNLFLKGFKSLGLDKIFIDRGIIECDDQLRLYAGFFLKRSSSKKNFHVDWVRCLENNAFTFLTPLYQEEDALHLLYKDFSGKECKYKYEVGKGILFGSDFTHSTEAGRSLNSSILLCFQFGTDLAKYNKGIYDAMRSQSPFLVLPDGRCVTNKKIKSRVEASQQPLGFK